jgi:Na+-driven multidrug efflux pump
MDPTHILGWLIITVWIVGIYRLIRTVIKPSPDEKLRWWDRLIRAVGAILLLGLLIGGLIWGQWLHSK